MPSHIGATPRASVVLIAAVMALAATLLPAAVEGAPGKNKINKPGIWEIQGAGHTSPLLGRDVLNVDGIVTAVSDNGFWMTDPEPDGVDATSDGIFIFRGGEPSPEVGQHVRVDGEVDEVGFGDLSTTQIRSFNKLKIVSSDNALPTTVIGVDRTPPSEVIDNDSPGSVRAAGAVFDPAQDGIDFWESLEGVRLQVADAVAVGPRNRFGEIAVVSQQSAATQRTPRGGIIVRQLGAVGDYRSGDFNPERVILDDGPSGIRTPRVNAGDEFTIDPVGVLDYSFGNFKLLITAPLGRVDNGLAREAARNAAPGELTVATYNVENLSAVDSEAKLTQLASQIVDNLRSPDLIAIEEMQDNTGDINDSANGDNGTVAADESWQALIDAIVATGGPTYDYRQIDPEDGADGGIPGGNIRVGFLFRTDRGLAFVDRPGGDATTDTDVVAGASGPELTISPGRVLDAELGGDLAFFDTRKSLAGEFTYNGEELFVVANHLSSKGDDDPLFGRAQPPVRYTEFRSGNADIAEDGWRHAQAQAVNDFVDEILAVDPDAHVIVLGDINDFDFSETVKILEGTRLAVAGGPDPDGSGPTTPSGDDAVLATLMELLPGEERYSYVFDGNSQVLDQILVSSSLLALDPEYDVVHVNSEFFAQASDHEPSVMYVTIPAAP